MIKKYSAATFDTPVDSALPAADTSIEGLWNGFVRRIREGTVQNMALRNTDPADDFRPNPDGTSDPDPLADSGALRAAIERIMSDDPDQSPLDEAERRERVAALRQEIEKGAYMSDEKIVDIVDRLLRRWKL